MNSVRQDLSCDQGSLFGMTLALFSDVEETTPFDLTGYTASFRIASGYDSKAPLLELSLGDGLTIAVPVDGEIGVRIEHTDTALLPPRHTSPLVYSLELIDSNGVVEEKMYGAFDVKPKVPST